MSLEPIGGLTLLAGFLCLLCGPRVAIPLLFCFTLLGAAAAAFVGALGGANIQPAHLLLLFLIIDLVARPALLRTGIGCFLFPRAGFWLLLTAVYGVGVTVIMPRLFAGDTYVFAIARSETEGLGVVSIPLAPSAANITQSIYFLGDVACFLVFYAYSTRRAGIVDIARAAVLCGIVNLLFAAVDLVTFWTGTAEVLGFIRNASYRMLEDVQLAGLKRIVGSFTEASAFAYMTLGLFAFNLRLWREKVLPIATGPVALLSLVALVFATSSTGYTGALGFMVLQYLFAIGNLLRRRASSNTLALLGFAPVLCALVVAAIAVHPTAMATVRDLLDVTLFNKLSSESGLERSAWNRQAMTVFEDTQWLGAGIGSVRASSWLIAVPANIGVIGALMYALFVLTTFFRRAEADDQLSRAIRAASRDACLALLVASSVAGSFIDLGLPFFIFAALASAPSRSSSLEIARSPRLSLVPLGAVVGRFAGTHDGAGAPSTPRLMG